MVLISITATDTLSLTVSLFTTLNSLTHLFMSNSTFSVLFAVPIVLLIWIWMRLACTILNTAAMLSCFEISYTLKLVHCFWIQLHSYSLEIGKNAARLFSRIKPEWHLVQFSVKPLLPLKPHVLGFHFSQQAYLPRIRNACKFCLLFCPHPPSLKVFPIPLANKARRLRTHRVRFITETASLLGIKFYLNLLSCGRKLNPMVTSHL